MMETPYRIEPCLFEDSVPAKIADLVAEVQAAAGGLGRDLHPDAAREAADLLRTTNTYYSNLIEGHRTRPRDIERAMAGAELDPERRVLALEAKAHMLVQREIDARIHDGTLPNPVSPEFLSWTHRRFYEEMPAELRFVERAGQPPLAIVPGRFRSDPGEEVTVGRHRPPSADRVGDFLSHFAQRYAAAESGAASRIVAIAAAHHRLNYIHPFMDGNGRVSRLMSHAMAQRAGIGASGLWSISRGLARGLSDRGEYKAMMDLADTPRQGDRDGRGNLSLQALADFCVWFLSVMLDQIAFAGRLFALEGLRSRYARLLADLGHDARLAALVDAVLRFGDLERGTAALVVQASERTARKALAEGLGAGFLTSSTPKGKVRIAFPLQYRERLFPNLFADEPAGAPA